MPSEWYVVSVYLIPRQANQRLSMARYATGTATEIQTQRNSNPVLTSASQQVAGMRFSSYIIRGSVTLALTLVNLCVLYINLIQLHFLLHTVILLPLT